MQKKEKDKCLIRAGILAPGKYSLNLTPPHFRSRHLGPLSWAYPWKGPTLAVLRLHPSTQDEELEQKEYSHHSTEHSART